MTLRLWLVRHGATDWSDEGRFNGWEDVPLNAKGREQALGLIGELAHRRFTGVWTSDLSRALQTAELAVGRAATDPRLREIDFGQIEGKTWDECPSEIRRSLLQFDSFTAPAGESVAGVRDRVGDFMDELREGDHLVFGHGGVIRILARDLGRDVLVRHGELLRLEIRR